MPDRVHQIRDFEIDAWPTQYRVGSKLQGVSEEKNDVPILRIGDDDGLYD